MMKIESGRSCKAFDERLATQIHLAADGRQQITLFRHALAALSPGQLVSLWFGRLPEAVPPVAVKALWKDVQRTWRWGLAAPAELGTNQEAIPQGFDFSKQGNAYLVRILGALRPHVRHRRQLFAWVYGPGPATEALAYVRYPSRERRVLVSLILSAARSRHSWLTSRLICAMAYRPRAFADMKATCPEGKEPWGALYRRVAIPKGSRSRYLWIPSPPLKAVQKSLLCLLQPTVDGALSEAVYGARAGLVAPTFTNAAAHLHRRTVVSFDIKDFFPSTNVSDIVRGIQDIAERGDAAVDPSVRNKYPLRFSRDGILHRIRWTDDLAVFVARLGTHRGRLPQGSPLSPLLANVAFAPIDKRIEQRLTQWIGQGRFRYTRYFDDITISLSPLQGAEASLSKEDVCTKCKGIVQDAFVGTRYRLNDSKTRVSDTSEGHAVTGVVVRQRSLTLPRSTRRGIRALEHSLRNESFVEAARRWRSSSGRPQYRLESISRGHRLQKTHLRTHRMSLERLATLMLRRFYPDLRLIALLPDWHVWQERIAADAREVSGKPMWALMEWVLAMLWAGSISAHVPDDAVPNRIVLRQGEVDVCALRAESSLAFFFLAAADAIAVVEYWHHINGFCNYLKSCPGKSEFEAIHQAGASLHELFSRIEIKQEDGASETVESKPDGRPVRAREILQQATRSLDESLREFMRLLDIDPDGQFGGRQHVLKTAFASDTGTYQTWLEAVFALTAGACPVLPAIRDGHGRAPSLVFEYVRIKNANWHGLAASDYLCIQEVEQGAGLPHGAGDQRPHLIQIKIAEWMSDAFANVNRGLQDGRSKSELVNVNAWHGSPSSRLADQVRRLECLHAAARSTATQRRLFQRTSGHGFAARNESLAAVIQSRSNADVWRAVEAVALDLGIVVWESIEPSLCEEQVPHEQSFPDEWRMKRVWKQLQPVPADDRLKLVEQLRNRAAHGPTPERRKDWEKIQKKVAALLGRKWNAPIGPRIKTYYHPTDLALTGYEGTGLKMAMIAAVGDWIEGLIESKPWVRG